MNSDEMVKASLGAINRMKTIDELTKETQKIKTDIANKGKEIQTKASGLLKNMTPKKKITDWEVKTNWSNQKIVFANYGIGIQNTYNTNATSMPEMDWESFVNSLAVLEQRKAELPTYLKPEKLKTMTKFLKNIGKLRIEREQQKHIIDKEITYVTRNMLSSLGGERASGYYGSYDDDDEDDDKKAIELDKLKKKAKIGEVIYHNDKFSFNDDNGNKVKVNINRPQLEDALVLEQIFDETKQILTNEISRLNEERDNFDYFIAELKKDFSNEMLIMELSK